MKNIKMGKRIVTLLGVLLVVFCCSTVGANTEQTVGEFKLICLNGGTEQEEEKFDSGEYRVEIDTGNQDSDAVLIVGLYTSNKDLYSVVADENGEQGKYRAVVNIPADQQYTMKAFLWHGLDKMEPIKVKEYQKKSNAKEILSFSVATPNVEGVIHHDINEITIETGLTFAGTLELTPTITTSVYSTVSPASGVKLDFIRPQVYTVTSENGETQKYVVRAYFAQSTHVPTYPNKLDFEGAENVVGETPLIDISSDTSTNVFKNYTNTGGSVTFQNDPLGKQGKVLCIEDTSTTESVYLERQMGNIGRPAIYTFKLMFPTPAQGDNLRAMSVSPKNWSASNFNINFLVTGNAPNYHLGYRTGNNLEDERPLQPLKFNHWYDIRLVYEPPSIAEPSVEFRTLTSAFEIWIDGEKQNVNRSERYVDVTNSTSNGRLTFGTASWTKGKFYVDDILIYKK